jgi:hypothetical protein
MNLAGEIVNSEEEAFGENIGGHWGSLTTQPVKVETSSSTLQRSLMKNSKTANRKDCTNSYKQSKVKPMNMDGMVRLVELFIYRKMQGIWHPRQTTCSESYGVISMDQIREFGATYIDQAVRPAQDTYLLYMCLMNSISKAGESNIIIWSDQYMVHGLPSGTLLLNVIVQESHLDTNGTISSIHMKLSSLDSYILTIGADITKFNGYVKLLINSLAAHGKQQICS